MIIIFICLLFKNIIILFFFSKDILIIINSLIIILLLLISIAFLTLLERKLLSSIQRRKGPNIVGFWGILQPFADGLKSILKESIIPSQANKIIYFISPILMFFLSLINWLIIPYSKGIVLSNLNLGILFIFAISSSSVYGIILSGWASNSKYAFLGSLRSAAQMISYEVSIGLIVMNISLIVGSLNLTDIVSAQKNLWFIVPFFPLSAPSFISLLAETNRIPFDLPEAEGELVSGYNVEYSAIGFALFSLAEYANIILTSHLIVIIFFGGWSWFINNDLLNFIILELKVNLFLFIFIWIRATFPRYRYDQLMNIGWKIFLPLSISRPIFYSSFFFAFNFLY